MGRLGFPLFLDLLPHCHTIQLREDRRKKKEQLFDMKYSPAPRTLHS